MPINKKTGQTISEPEANESLRSALGSLRAGLCMHHRTTRYRPDPSISSLFHQELSPVLDVRGSSIGEVNLVNRS